jgi:hypothetical protein
VKKKFRQLNCGAKRDEDEYDAVPLEDRGTQEIDFEGLGLLRRGQHGRDEFVLDDGEAAGPDSADTEGRSDGRLIEREEERKDR